MAIVGTFEADFTQFLEETQKAQVQLSGFSHLADDTAVSMTKLEKASASAAPSIGTLHSSYQQFDGVLRAVGVNIGPQISALEDLGRAAMSTGAEIGLLGQAGLAIGVAMAAWEIGKWIGHITGMDEALDEWVTHLAGAKTAVEMMADAAEAALSHQQEMIFEAAAIAGKSTANLQDAEKALASFYKQQEKDAADAEAATKKHIEAIGQVNQALKSHADILRDVSPAEQAVIKSALEHGIAQSLLAESTGKSALQIRTLAQELAAEKKSSEEAAAAARQYDAQLMISYTNQITMLGQLEKAQQGHFGLEGQIEQLHLLAVAEDEATAAALARVTSEKDRLKIREGNEKRQQEIEIQTAQLEQQLADQKGASMARGLAAQKELNKAQGLDAQGAILLPIDAMTTYQQKIDAINATMQDGIEKTAALRAANQELTDSFLKSAQAADTETAAVSSNTAAKGAAAAASSAASGATAAQTATARATSSFGGGTIDMSRLNEPGATSPEILSWLSQGYTLNEAIAIALGQGAHIIGTSPSHLKAIGFGGGRATGGAVSAGEAYMVGERGPELFVPGASGAMSPTVPSAGGQSIQIVINGSLLSTQSELAALVEQAMVAAYRRGGNRLPV